MVLAVLLWPLWSAVHAATAAGPPAAGVGLLEVAVAAAGPGTVMAPAWPGMLTSPAAADRRATQLTCTYGTAGMAAVTCDAAAACISL
jgi:hypothetical protein